MAPATAPVLTLSHLERYLHRCRRNPSLFPALHSHMITSSLLHDPYASSRLLLLSSALLPLPLHLLLLLRLPNPNPFSFNSAMASCLSLSSPDPVLPLYSSMLLLPLPPDRYTHPLLARACALRASLPEGMQVHAHVLRMGFALDPYSVNTLMHFYSVCRNCTDARRMFDETPLRDEVSWNTILGAYVRAGDAVGAREVFEKMPKHDTVGWNSMITLLGEKGRPGDARRLFDAMPERDAVSWTAMVSCYERNGMWREALDMFASMIDRGVAVADEVAMISAVAACAQLVDTGIGQSLHGLAVKGGIDSYVNLRNAMIHMYFSYADVDAAKRLFESAELRDRISWNSMISGNLRNQLVDDARLVFDGMPDKDTVSWSTMISGYTQDERFLETLALFREMQFRYIKPDETALASVLSACAHLASLEQARSLHAYMKKSDCKVTVVLGTALVDMYMKCGSSEEAIRVFHSMEQWCTSTWNALIMGLAVNGFVNEALERFEEMKKVGVVPNEITFMGVLGACRHAGLVNEGQSYFSSMMKEYEITPNSRHYGCMIDLLGRAGLLEEAEELMETMPVSPDTTTWGALLNASWKHGNPEMGARIGRKMVELEPENEAFHVLLSNIYACTGSWDHTLQVRGIMKEQGISKSPGCSLLEVNGIEN